MATDYISTVIARKEKILKRWIEAEVVTDIFKQHAISVRVFKNHFATRILDYFVGVVKGEKEAGNCPAVGVMLMFFEHKNLQLDELFLICDSFKKSMLAELLMSGELNAESLDDVFYLFGQNFAGIVRRYVDDFYEKPEKSLEDKVGLISNKSQDNIECFEANFFDFDSSDEQSEEIALADCFIMDENDADALEELIDEMEMHITQILSYNISSNVIPKFISELNRFGQKLDIIGARNLSKLFCMVSSILDENRSVFEQNLDTVVYLFAAMLSDMMLWERAARAGETALVQNIEKSVIANLEQVRAIVLWKAGAKPT